MNRGFAETKEEGEELISNFLGQYPKVKDFLERCVADALVRGYTQDPYGRIRWYQLPRTSDRELLKSARKSIGRQGQNFAIQSSSASVTKLAIAEVDDYLHETGEGYLVLTIHDSIIASLKLETAGKAINKIIELMEAAGPKIIPGIVTPVDAEVGRKEKRICALTGLDFKVPSHVFDGEKVFVNPQRYEPRIEKLLAGIPEREHESYLRKHVLEQSLDWREKNKDIVYAVQEINLRYSLTNF